MIAIGVDLVQFVDVAVVRREGGTLVAATVYRWRWGCGLGFIVGREVAERGIAGGSTTVRRLGLLLLFGSVDVDLIPLLTKCFLVFPEGVGGEYGLNLFLEKNDRCFDKPVCLNIS